MALVQGARLGTFPFLFSGVWVAFSQPHPGLQQGSVVTHLSRGSSWKHFPRSLEGGESLLPQAFWRAGLWEEGEVSEGPETLRAVSGPLPLMAQA